MTPCPWNAIFLSHQREKIGSQLVNRLFRESVESIQKRRPRMLRYDLIDESVGIQLVQTRGQYAWRHMLQGKSNILKPLIFKIESEQYRHIPRFGRQTTISDIRFCQLNRSGRLTVQTAFFRQHILWQQRMSTFVRRYMLDQAGDAHPF